MASLRVSVPGKSFLAGEYLAIKEGPALVFASAPRFELLVNPGSGDIKGIHTDSPAGKLIADNLDYFKKFDLEFIDPHAGRGGWGASTAQFLSAFVLNEWRDACEQESLKSLAISRLLEAYWKYAWSGEGARPSGADLVAQYKGSLTLFEKRSGLISVYPWSFAEIDFALIATGKKVATHEHLRTLGDFDEKPIEAAMKALQESFQFADSIQFVKGIQKAALALSGLGFVAEHTVTLLRELQQVAGVLAAKGCGALGADVVLVVFDKKQQTSLEKTLQERGLEITATSQNLSHGLEIEVRNPS
jgi:mevalonate kinase